MASRCVLSPVMMEAPRSRGAEKPGQGCVHTRPPTSWRASNTTVSMPHLCTATCCWMTSRDRHLWGDSSTSSCELLLLLLLLRLGTVHFGI